MIEQCTYDGTIYNARLIVEKIGHLCDYIMFDEAWAGFMKFHPLYAGRFAMGLHNLGPDAPGIIATQSTHKQLASFSQASQIHVKDRHIRGQRRRIEHRRFNEFFMLHASTSPFYPLFASLDVGAQMMKGRSGEVLWDDTIRLGIELRKKMRAIRREFEEKEQDPARRWFFEAFVPDRVALSGPRRRRPREIRLGTRADRRSRRQLALSGSLRPARAGMASPMCADGYAITDPNKLTLLTPGFDRDTGAYADYGIPAPVVAQYLRENRVVPEKNDLNALLFLLTPGVESSKAGTLAERAGGVQAAPRRQCPPRRGDRGIRAAAPGALCGRAAARPVRRDARVSSATAPPARCSGRNSRPRTCRRRRCRPHEAVRQMVRNNVDYVPIDEAFGRIATTMFVVYPPGIATIVPGERLDDRARPMLDYLKMFERSANLFPGFEAEIQGVYRETGADGAVRFYTYVVRE